MENLHLKNLDLTKVREQIEKNKLKSILETNNEITNMFSDHDEDSNTENDKEERKYFLNLNRYFI